jgi:hypothetical protein
MPSPTPAPTALPNLQSFCISVPLYAPVQLHNTHKSGVYKLITNSASIDCFCVNCDQHSVFITGKNDIGIADYNFDLSPRVFSRDFVCTRVHSHSAIFHFRIHEERIEKIGQSPSLAELSDADIRKYKKVLEQSQFRELSKAVGLASHGVGIGSFVYLRRIFEGLISEAAEIAKNLPGWDADAFAKSRMEEKILLLKPHLPEFLVEQRKVYGILSAGIHSLSEELCLEAFPVVRLGIEMMLEQKLAAKVQQEKMKEAASRLEQIQRKITPAQPERQ